MVKVKMPTIAQPPVREYFFPYHPPLPLIRQNPQFGSMKVRGGFNYPLYRYTNEKWYNSSCLSGSWRLGTIRSYRDAVAYGDERGDDSEGFRIFGNDEVYRYPVSLFYGAYCQNAWTLCLTQARDDRFYGWEGNNCCIEIFDEKFFVAISEAISDRASFTFVSPCSYVTPAFLAEYASNHRADGVGGSIYMGLIKPDTDAYRWQKEIRFIAEPRGLGDYYNKIGDWSSHIESDMNHPSMFPDLASINVFAPEAARYTRLIERKAS